MVGRIGARAKARRMKAKEGGGGGDDGENTRDDVRSAGLFRARVCAMREADERERKGRRGLKKRERDSIHALVNLRDRYAHISSGRLGQRFTLFPR